MLTIKKNTENDVLTYLLEGQIDTNTAPQLAADITENLKDNKKLILDLLQVDYVSSAGLRVFLTAKGMLADEDGFVLKNVNDDVMEVLEMTGFSDILTIEN